MKAKIEANMKVTLWVVWLVMLSSVIFQLVFIWPNFGAQEQALPPLAILPMVMAPIGIAVFVRWFVIPGVTTAQAVLTASIIGLAMGESLAIYGVFLFPDYFKPLFVISVLMILQYIPLYAFKPLAEPPAVRDLSNT